MNQLSTISLTFNGNSHSNIGGGVYINIVSIQSAFVTISKCNFTNITGCLATAVNISVIDYVYAANIKLNHSRFYNNYRIDVPGYLVYMELQGGAVKIKTAQSSVANNVLTGSSLISILNSIFLHNRAQHCAGIGIWINTISIPTMVRVNRSHFYDNVAIKGGRAGGICIINSDENRSIKLKHSIAIEESHFERNIAMDGAAVLLWPEWSGISLYSITVTGCTFNYNVMRYQFTVPYDQTTSGY